MICAVCGQDASTGWHSHGLDGAPFAFHAPACTCPACCPGKWAANQSVVATTLSTGTGGLAPALRISLADGKSYSIPEAVKALTAFAALLSELRHEARCGVDRTWTSGDLLRRLEGR